MTIVKIGREDLIRLGAIPAQKNEPHTLVANTKKITDSKIKLDIHYNEINKYLKHNLKP